MLETLTILQDIANRGVKLTPMMQQYYRVKQRYANHIVLFRMGDFYEAFFADAHKAAEVLGITLTHRGKLGEVPIPMAGIPHHAAAGYVDRLTEAGLLVAICEQVEDAAEAKGIVRREVTQVVSPGMPFDLDKACGTKHHYSACAAHIKKRFYLILLDFTTGEFNGRKLPDLATFLATLQALAPRELITFKNQWSDFPEVEQLCRHGNIQSTHVAKEYFDAQNTRPHTEKLIPGYAQDEILKLTPQMLGPLGALAWFVQASRPEEEVNFFHIRPFSILGQEGKMKVTLPTLKGLEIFPKDHSSRQHSLLGLADRCKSAAGSRALAQLFLTPLNEPGEIEERLDLVEFFTKREELLASSRQEMTHVRDVERILAKAATGRAGPSDLINLAATIECHRRLSQLHTGQHCPPQGPLGKLAAGAEEELAQLACDIGKTINDDPQTAGLIKKGLSKERDTLAALAAGAEGELKKLEEKYRKETGISKLRIKSNNIFGHFVELSRGQSALAPATFLRRQTLVNAERYTTKELTRLERDILQARERLQNLERQLFKDILAQVAQAGRSIQSLASRLAKLDVWLSLAHLALQKNFTRPHLREKKGLELTGVWHPLLATGKPQLVAHDLSLDQERFFALITGPNMAGKTTVMREVAIVQLLAQIGSFVPAKRASVSLCDYLFSRLGAGDDILKGQSTFMMEMTETAEILRHATADSLILLDEIGRGTSTYDGLSIAWALVEHITKNVQALTLFATHYHELIELVDTLPGALNLTVETISDGNDVKFLYRLIEGGATESFGIHVAKLAGLPASVLRRSRSVLNSLERPGPGAACNLGQADLFGPPSIPTHLEQLEKQFDHIDPMEMTPMEALAKLQELKGKLDGAGLPDIQSAGLNGP